MQRGKCRVRSRRGALLTVTIQVAVFLGGHARLRLGLGAVFKVVGKLARGETFHFAVLDGGDRLGDLGCKRTFGGACAKIELHRGARNVALKRCARGVVDGFEHRFFVGEFDL